MDDLDRQIDDIRTEARQALESVRNQSDLDAFRIKFLSRKGLISSLFDRMGELSSELKPAYGQKLNQLRSSVQANFDAALKTLDSQTGPPTPVLDLTLPGKRRWVGSKHPLTQTLDEIKRIFLRMGFDIATGPEIEDDFHNFEALNFPPDHPARDMQDTFFIAKTILLRTHTSPVQIRVMEQQKPPIRVIMPGRVYRNEAISARSYCLFHQVEGLYVDEKVTFGELKATVVAFANQFYGNNIKYRFRPSYFPFTEPSAEMDITCFLCGGRGCRVCKHSGWLEILGCGMVNPNVYRHVHYPANRYSGYAFGMGIERITMLRLGLDDIRIFFENDIRFLSQFS